MSARHFTSRVERFPRRIPSCHFRGRRHYVGRLRKKGRGQTITGRDHLRSAIYRRRFPAAAMPLDTDACALPPRICAGIGCRGRTSRVACQTRECPMVASWSLGQLGVPHEL
jgi:hypothetical protein